MNVEKTALPGVLLIEPIIYRDSRGFLLECFQSQRYIEHGVETGFVQDTWSRSSKGTLRGLHFQSRHPQGKLVYVTSGEIYDVAVDIRKGSPTFSHWCGAILNDVNHKQLYVPQGFAHGFCVLSDVADVLYKFTDYYYPDDDCGFIWNDEAIGIDWPIDDPLLSDTDRDLPVLDSVAAELLPVFGPSTE